MAVFETLNHMGINFTVRAVAVKNPYGRGWVIQCRSDDPKWYGGKYVRNVGFADAVKTGHIAFRRKRDAVAAIKEAMNLGIITTEASK